MKYSIGGSLKAIAAFVVSFGAFLISVLADPQISAALPEGFLKWLTVIGVPALVAFGTWLTRQLPSVAEAEEILRRARERNSLPQ